MKHPGRITIVKRLVCLPACLLGLMALAAARDEPVVKITGRVTSGATPVAQAIVRLQATDLYAMTDADGKFTLNNIPAQGDTYITAAHAGYYNNRVKVSGATAPLEIQLRPVPGEDNAAYQWQDPTPSPQHKDNCGNCHTAIYGEWSKDAHGQSSLNPLLLTMYNGTDVHGNPNVRPGYRLDWNDFGNCATCHAPLAALTHKLSADLSALGGVEKSGVSCDFCHKIKDVQFDRSFPNFADIKVWRPPQGEKLMFGPFDDATFPREEPDFSYSPLFKSSQLCAGCHDGMFWGVPVYETYSEWRQSPYNEKGVQCQDCHMKPTGDLVRFANAEAGGHLRAAARISSHALMGPDRTRFMQEAIKMDTKADLDGQFLRITVNITNTGAGHHIPTGQPMRNMILLVSCADEAGRPLRFLVGERVPYWGGNLAGSAGKGYAKILTALSEYTKAALIVNDQTTVAEFPAPFWNRNKIMSDNRIAAKASDQSTYVFQISPQAKRMRVQARLIFRRAFKPLADAKGWDLPDIALASNEFEVDRP